MLSIPAGLADLGVEESQLDGLAAMAMDDPSVGGNPVKMTIENTRLLFSAAL